MPRSWDADWVITESMAGRLIGSAFPELKPVEVEWFGEGWDNALFRVNRSFIFRFPRRKEGVPLIETERRLLGWLGARLPLPIPCPEFDAGPAGDYPCRFLGYRYLQGTVLAEATLGVLERTEIAEPLAAFLSALHATPVGDARNRGADYDSIARMDPQLRGPKALRRLNRLRHIDALPDPTLVDRVEALLAKGPQRYAARRNTLVHGDLHSGQILVVNGRISGIVDWGDAHIGDRGVDLAAVHAILPAEAHREFIDRYGPVGDEEWAIARSRAVWLTAAMLDHAVDTGQQRRAADALETLERLLLPGPGATSAR